MATSDKLGLGLDDIIRLDRGTDRRGGGRGGNRGRGARGVGNQFRARGGGGIVRGCSSHICIWLFSFFVASRIEHAGSSPLETRFLQQQQQQQPVPRWTRQCRHE